MTHIERISEIIEISIDNITAIYHYGSYVYDTFTESSDYDFIVVSNSKSSNSLFVEEQYNIHVYTEKEFQLSVDTHDISALECLWLPTNCILLERKKPTFNLDLGKLRTSISTITSNSWVKGKKKLIILGDYDKYLAIKSVFHSLRILGFGLQVATEGRIIDYLESNWVLNEIRKLSNQYDHSELWTKIEEKFKKEYDNRKSRFKQVCPKELTEQHNQRKSIENLFKKHGITINDELIKDLLIFM